MIIEKKLASQAAACISIMCGHLGWLHWSTRARWHCQPCMGAKSATSLQQGMQNLLSHLFIGRVLGVGGVDSLTALVVVAVVALHMQTH